MNLKRFTAKTSREALAMVRQAFGDDAVVMSTKPCPEGVEMLAMAPESVLQLERIDSAGTLPRSASAAAVAPRWSPTPRGGERGERGERVEPPMDTPVPRSAAVATTERRALAQNSVADDVHTLQMSTLSFQDFVRDRMLKRRHAEQASQAVVNAPPAPPAAAATPERAAASRVVAPIEAARARAAAQRELPVLREEIQLADPLPMPMPAAAPVVVSAARKVAAPQITTTPAQPPSNTARGDQIEMMSELRSMRGLIEQRFNALAFMEKLQRQPRQAQLAQCLLDSGFSPALIRKLVQSLPADCDALTWASDVLERNLATSEREHALEDTAGALALIGSTGVGKTTSTAKLAAAFATRHGAPNLGLITLDAYRVGAHEQLRTYGRILGVPVHTAHDRASLEDLLDLLAGKKLVLIDTAGMAQRDTRTRELLDMLSHRSIQKLLVVNASAQGETIEDQLGAYAAPSCLGVVLSKMDEAVKLGPALDAMIRHKLKVVAVANGQRVPEDWHRLSAHALMQRALKNTSAPAWRLDDDDVSLIFAGLPTPPPHGRSAMALHA